MGQSKMAEILRGLKFLIICFQASQGLLLTIVDIVSGSLKLRDRNKMTLLKNLKGHKIVELLCCTLLALQHKICSTNCSILSNSAGEITETIEKSSSSKFALLT